LSKSWIQFRLDIRNLLKILYFSMYEVIETLEKYNNEKLLDLDRELEGF